MISTEITLIVFGGALVGMFLRVHIPEHHLSEHSKDVIKLGMGLIATMTALVLGLVIATAKSSYDTQADAVKHTAAKVLLLDRLIHPCQKITLKGEKSYREKLSEKKSGLKN